MILRVVLLTLVLLCRPAALADVCRADAFSLLADLPGAARFVLLVDDGALQHRNPAGVSFERAIGELGDFAGTAAAWREMADVLELTPEAAFDALLGRRFVLVFADGKDGSGEWALLTEVTTSVERRLLRRLRPSPRQIKGGLPILAVENGRFELTSSPRGIVHQGAGGVATLLMAPASARGLFDSMLPLLSARRAEDALGERVWFGKAREVGAGGVVVLWQGRNAPGEFVAASFSMVEGGWDGVIQASPSFLLPWVDAGRAGRASGLPAFAGLGNSVVAGMIGTSDRLTTLLLSMVEGGDALMSIPPASSGAGVRSGVVVRAERGAARGRARSSVTMFRETGDPSRMIAYADRVLSDQAQRTGASPGRPGPTFRGLPGDVVRTVPAGETGRSLSWCVTACDDASGWWIAEDAHVVPGGMHGPTWLRMFSDVLNASERGERPAALLSAGVLRPAGLIDVLAKDVRERTEEMEVLRAAQWVREVTWLAQIGSEGVAQGAVGIRMRMPSPRGR
ncbi:MAG: hypothetical protein KIT24_10540 [Phycisphaeraceae bacterium]|nr:hypothetical protein [Phycisphaeraceae bacterium]